MFDIVDTPFSSMEDDISSANHFRNCLRQEKVCVIHYVDTAFLLRGQM